MNRERTSETISTRSLEALFTYRFAKFIRTDYTVYITPSYMTHAAAMESLRLTPDDIRDGGYLEANMREEREIIIRDWADTIGIGASSKAWVGEERDMTEDMFILVIQGLGREYLDIKIRRA
jgi:hypothetical protein